MSTAPTRGRTSEWTLARRLWSMLALAGVFVLVLVSLAAIVLVSVHRQQEQVDRANASGRTPVAK